MGSTDSGMDILYLLIPMSLLLVFVIGVIFWWSIRSGQFEDLDGPGYRVIMDDDDKHHPPVVAEAPQALDFSEPVKK